MKAPSRPSGTSAPSNPPSNQVHGRYEALNSDQQRVFRQLQQRSSLWESMKLGDEKALGDCLDRNIDRQVPHDLIERQIRDSALQHGIRTKIVDLLWKQRLSNEPLRRRIRQLRELRLRMANAWKSMPNKAQTSLQERAQTPRVSFNCELSPDDDQLVSQFPRDKKLTKQDDEHRRRSARRAEKASLEYYRDLGCHVVDVSIEALRERTEGWWKFDLRADGRPLDVKNVRCSRKDRFTEHFWKTQKRDGDFEIPIVGVVWMEDSESSVVIGELNLRELEHFRERINTYAHGREVFAEEYHWSRYVPGWLFEYPEDHYRATPDWLGIVELWLRVSEELTSDVPPWILGFAASRGSPLQHPSLQTDLLCSIQQHFQHFGLSRRSLFWFVLVHMLSLSYMEDPKNNKTKLVEHLFPNGDGGKNFPLGLFDPRNYVWSLVHALSTMIESNRPLLENVSQFRLHGFGILQGRVCNHWHTILAYCGNCGNSPIYLGETDKHKQGGDGSCRSCPCERQRLVCDECNHCGHPQCKGKEYRTVREALEAAEKYPGWRQVRNGLHPPNQPAGA